VIFDMEPNDIIRPRGSANKSVSAKIRQVFWKPDNSLSVIAKKLMIENL